MLLDYQLQRCIRYLNYYEFYLKIFYRLVIIIHFKYAQVAQLVEQATENRCVGGSIPPLGTMFL